MRTRKPLPLNLRNPWDKAVVQLSRKRFTALTISRHLGLTTGQVNYRRLKFNCTLSLPYRQGKTPGAQAVIARIDRMLDAVTALRRNSRI